MALPSLNDPYIYLMTDGTPDPTAQNPCDLTDQRYIGRNQQLLQELSAYNVQVRIVGFGPNWEPSVLTCLVDDPFTQIISAADASSLQLISTSSLLPSAVPLPADGPLLAGALGLLALLRRRRRA